ncbi:thaumatin family protein [Dactylosporangium sp. NPDC000555]|uniref:thaumatin family protein n=1 Tax=Dactylosporangium sp. NPDC000555 TaxID=3154260 RepID=UPI003330FD12
MRISRRALAGAGAALVLVAAALVTFTLTRGSAAPAAGASPGSSISPVPPGPGPSETSTSASPAGPGDGVGRLAAASPSSSSSPAPSGSRPPSVPAGARTVTLVNALGQRIWAAATPDKAHPLAATGWVIDPGQSVTVVVPSGWGGRFWGRTGCSFDASGAGHCQTGDCGGRFQCTGSGATPATLAEFALAAWGGMDFYDVSMVDGSNLPMWINVAHSAGKDPVSPTGCVAAGCTRPVDCPQQMQAAGGACKNPCAAFGGDTYCCRGPWAGREHCVPAKWPVDYTQVFKRAAPHAYSYAFDDSATMACKGGCSYRVTFGVTP